MELGGGKATDFRKPHSAICEYPAGSRAPNPLPSCLSARGTAGLAVSHLSETLDVARDRA